MDIEKLMGIEVETVEGEVIGEIVGIELYRNKINIIVDADFVVVDGGPDGDDGEPVPVPVSETNDKPDLFVGDEPEMAKVVNLFGGKYNAVSHKKEA